MKSIHRKKFAALPEKPRGTWDGWPVCGYRGSGRRLHWRCGARILEADRRSREASRSPSHGIPQKLTAGRDGFMLGTTVSPRNHRPVCNVASGRE
ncbi:unnamed protein product [Boreogadus saida]